MAHRDPVTKGIEELEQKYPDLVEFIKGMENNEKKPRMVLALKQQFDGLTELCGTGTIYFMLKTMKSETLKITDEFKLATAMSEMAFLCAQYFRMLNNLPVDNVQFGRKPEETKPNEDKKE